MLENVDQSKPTKSERKNTKKINRKVLNLLRGLGNNIELSEEPTYNLFIGNGGMLCGVNREDLLSILSKIGRVRELIMLPQKSFSLVSYSSLEAARNATKALEGYIFDKKTLPPAPLFFKFIHSEIKDISVDCRIKYPIEGKPDLVKGLILREEFVSDEYESKLVQFFNEQLQNVTGSEQSLKHRKVLHYGYEFLYGSNNVDRSKPLAQKIPSICAPFLEQLKKEQLLSHIPDQLTVNQYQPGQGIPSHVDTHSAFEDRLVSLSLNSQICMDFTHPDGTSMPVVVPKRSVLVMCEESRYLWSHGITPRKHDIVYISHSGEEKNESLTLRGRETRISLTFRKILHKPCDCNFVEKCDSQQPKKREVTRTNLVVPSTNNEAGSLEGEHVYKVYEEIADHFSSTRHSPWPRVKEFLCNLPPGSLVADVGCGNGKYLGVNNKIVTVGSDRSFNLAKICEERKFEVLVADCLSMPYRTCAFDATICIAVVHHLSTESRRLAALKELVRITDINGLILVYVWAIEQKLEDINLQDDVGGCSNSPAKEKNQDETLPDHSKNVPNGKNSNENIEVSEGRYTFQQQDLLVPWHLKKGTKGSPTSKLEKSQESKLFHRFYHVFIQGELQNLCLQIKNIAIQDIYFDCGNWCVIMKKIK